MKKLPLKTQISLLVSAVLAAITIVISMVVYEELEESMLNYTDGMLRAMANAIFVTIDDKETPDDQIAEIRSITATSNPKSSTRYWIWKTDDAKPIFSNEMDIDNSTQWFNQIRKHPPPSRKVFTSFNASRNQKHFRIFWIKKQTSIGHINVAIAYTIEHVEDEMKELLRTLIILGIITILVASIITTTFVIWTFKPIEKTAQTLDLVTAGNIGQTDLRQHTIPQELEPFVKAVETMLTRLDHAMKKQKQFTADASHELRTPLTIAKSTLQTALRRPRDNNQYQQAMQDTLTDLARMHRLIDQLLILANLDEKKQLPKPEYLRLDLIIQDILDTLTPAVQTIESQIHAENLPQTMIYGDKELLTRLFQNLLDNAFKYGPPKTAVTIQINHLNQNQNQPLAQITIHDQGGNIPNKALPHLFDRFYRAEKSRARTTGGTGLGLAIAQQIVLQHQGNINITSKPKLGTTVYIDFPLVQPKP